MVGAQHSRTREGDLVFWRIFFHLRALSPFAFSLHSGPTYAQKNKRRALPTRMAREAISACFFQD
jgi:hypothetical protein